MDRPIAWARITASSIVARGPVLFYAILTVKSSAGDGICRVHDGDNANAPRVMELDLLGESVGVPAARSEMWKWPKPILLQGGLFVDFTLNVFAVTAFFMPVREEQVVARVEEVVEGAAE